jgi:4-carboxymuconolactone decarboxylase
MSDTLDEKGKRGIAVISSMMGEAFGKALAEHATSGGFASAIARMAIDYSFADSWGRDGLARRDRSLLTLGILIALRQTAELKNHVKIGVANGLTAAEIEEVLIHASSYVGFPSVATATTAALEALREIGKAPDTKTAEERGLL